MSTPETILPLPLFMPIAGASTAVNRTGSWSTRQPRYQDKTAPCASRCPCGEEIPRIEMLASRGEYLQAWRTILLENPFPGSCGRVCFHPCEGACNRDEFDAPVAINALERFLDDQAWAAGSAAELTPRAATGRRIAIAGAGPAGLAAAWFLTLLGHRCEIFEAAEQAGGLLRYGIPAYRLPAQVLTREIARIEALGVGIHCGTLLDEAFIATARSRFDALFIGCGNGRSLALDIPGGELARDGLDFLRACRSQQPASEETGSASVLPAAVIGGGNSAIDVARTLVRLGRPTVIVYRRRREDMPAFNAEVERALEEGVQLVELSAPLTLRRTDDHFELTLQRMRSAEPGPDGRRRVTPVPGETASLPFAAVYTAIGAAAASPWAALTREEPALRLSHSRLLQDTAAGLPIVLGGDLVNREESVADAIASGKEAAIALDLLFSEGTEAIAPGIERCRVGEGEALSMEIHLGGERAGRSRRVVRYPDLVPDYFTPAPAERGLALAPAAATTSFSEVEAALDEAPARLQAERCFNCGYCNDCDTCRTFCPEVAVEGGSTRRILPEYCKGCGICLTECPRCAMVMEEAQS